MPTLFHPHHLCASSITVCHLFTHSPLVPVLVSINRAVLLLVERDIQGKEYYIQTYCQPDLRSPSHLVAAVGSHVAEASTGTTARIDDYTLRTLL